MDGKSGYNRKCILELSRVTRPPDKSRLRSLIYLASRFGGVRESICKETSGFRACATRGAEGFFFFKGLAKRFFLKGLAEPSVEFELQQAIGEGLFAGSSFLQQALGKGPSAGSSFAASSWERTIRRVFFCSKLLGKVHS